LGRGIGTGGGHMKSAGGQIPLNDKNYNEIVETVKKRLISKIFGTGEAEEKSL
jgi:nanoRNase/pAp phosphatase (c-di-AMP/oligoRNAs hydrolase)